MKLDTMSGESLKLGAVGSRPVREYHLYGVLEDNASGVHLGGVSRAEQLMANGADGGVGKRFFIHRSCGQYYRIVES